MRSKKEQEKPDGDWVDGWSLVRFFPVIFQMLHLDGTLSLSFPTLFHYLPTHTLKFVAIYRNGLRGNVLRHIFFSSRLRFATARQMHFLLRSVDSQRELLNLLLIHCKGKKWMCLVYPLDVTVHQESMSSAKWTYLYVFYSSQKYILHIKSVQSSFELRTHWN